MDVHSWPLDTLSLWFSELARVPAHESSQTEALVGDAMLKCACVDALARRPGATAESVTLVASEALSNRLMSELADVILWPICFCMDDASEHARATRVEAAASAVASRSRRGRRALDQLAAFLIAVARDECINPKGRLVELRGCVATIPDDRGWRAIVKLPGGPVCSAVHRVRKGAERAACTEALQKANLSTTAEWLARKSKTIYE